MYRNQFLAGLVCLSVTACAHGFEQKFTTVSNNLQPLRDDFNRESAKTRVVMLLSPT